MNTASALTSAERTAAQLLVECLAAEGCEYVFSVPGEETMDVLDALGAVAARGADGAPRHVTTRHEQGAAFMADVYGRLTGRAAVAMATLGPGATNLITGVADAYLDRAPMVAITGQAGSDKLHKEAHQVVDIVRMVEPVTKWNTRVERVEAIPEIVRKAFRVAVLEKPGPTHIELPENLAAAPVEAAAGPLKPGRTYFPEPTDEAIAHAAELIATSERPLVLAGNGVLRRRASDALRAFARGLHVPVAVTFMGKGAIDDRSHLSLMAVGLQARDHVLSGFDRADLVVCVGYDLVEYAPARWNPDGRKRIVHIDTQPSEVDAQYRPEVELVGDIDGTLRRLLAAVQPRGISGRDAGERHEARDTLVHADLRMALLEELSGSVGAGLPGDAPRITPQRAIFDLREALGPEDIVVSDVGAHKVWVARLYQAYEPNTVIISNGFAAMGISVPGAIAAKLVHPERKVVALCGDGGFLMNSQELETAKRIGANVTVVVWRDDGYGLIDWKQRNEFGRPFGVEFGNPDFVAYAESFGIAGFRPASAGELLPCLRQALDVDGPALVEVPIDYRENLRLTEHLGALAGA
ncbi:MAG TPA: acetolactate synthase large subunit [Candidatus Limnocylindrales bacterium]|nr:acetolactate synthase large subunit [Candidatus Limnocylindrales bacterium]